MFKKLILAGLMMLGVSSAAIAAPASPVVGKAAPAFSALDTKGASVDLDVLKGKTIVLEWTNYGCPFVRKHYDSKSMQKLQQAAVADNVVWITIMSSAAGKEGFYADDAKAQAAADGKGAASSHLIRDAKGELGRLYGASVTPHMYVIDPQGVLVYKGAIDDQPSADPDTLFRAKNYVVNALADLKAGTPVKDPESQPYGCSVKY